MNHNYLIIQKKIKFLRNPKNKKYKKIYKMYNSKVQKKIRTQ